MADRQTLTGISAPSLRASGVNGNSPVRVVGWMPMIGPPSSGTYSSGDIVYCNDGAWLCGTGGTPGTWQRLSKDYNTLTWVPPGGGNLSVAAGTYKWYHDAGAGVVMTLVKARATVVTAPTGAAINLDINKNGSSILSSPLTIAATAYTGTSSGSFTSATLADGDYLTIDIDQVGSTVPGAGLLVQLTYSITAG